MKKAFILIPFICVFFGVLKVQAQVSTVEDSTASQPKYSYQSPEYQSTYKKKKNNASFEISKVFFGGSLGFTFGNVTTIRINPLIGYSVTPKLSAGITGLYEYTDYSGQNFSNYGGSVFARYKIVQQLYAHTEFSYINYEIQNGINSTIRQGVPFILVGGGYAQKIGRNTYAYAQILFDVLQDPNSPYFDWDPFYSVGVSVGF